MMQPNLLGLFLRGRRYQVSLRRRFSANRRLYRPKVEDLEGRCLPSTITVMNNQDSGAGSLRQAILDASSGDTIDFQSGLSSPITLTGGELAISKNLTISGPGAAVLAVSGSHSSRIFKVTGTSVTVTISGLTMTNGFYQQGLADPHGGSAIFNDANLAISDCTFTDNGV